MRVTSASRATSGEDGAEACGVALAQVGGRLHARQQDFDLRVPGPGPADDGEQVVAQGIDIQSPQAVVGPQLDHEHAHRRAQQPLQPPQAPRAGVAADARVHHTERKSGPVDARPDPRGKGVFPGVAQAVAFGEARAQEEDNTALGRGVRRRDGGL